jgi:hypothetical protein
LFPRKTVHTAPWLYGGEEGSAAADFWAFGVIMCELLTGEFAFDGDWRHESERLAKMRSAERPSFPDRALPVLREVLGSCWNADPRQRMTAEAICAAFASAEWKIVKGADAQRVTVPGQVGRGTRVGRKIHVDRVGAAVVADRPGERAPSSPEGGVGGVAPAVAGRELSFSVYVNGEATARVVTIEVTADSSGRDILRALGGAEVPSLWRGPRDVSDAKAEEIWYDGCEYEAGTKVSRLVAIGEGQTKRVVTEALVLEVDFLEAISKAFDQEVVAVARSALVTEARSDAAPGCIGQLNLRVVSRTRVLRATADLQGERVRRGVQSAEDQRRRRAADIEGDSSSRA